ncbi:MAG TPA: methyltransferase domain-containing protein [Polyangiaceae bacterium]|nr:methyltransferase domain-containing protein [Polyangiaceae bacterium]
MSISEEMIPVLPQYQRSPKANVFAAIFPNRELEVDLGRTRRYPGLLGLAPDTRALYDAAAQLLSGAERVLDYGCGSGMGAAELRCHFQHVTALDCDPLAVEFARAYLRSVSVARDDAEAPVPPEQLHDGIVIIDVLGQTIAPDAALRAARRWLTPHGRVFVAEPRACPSQSLQPPVVRAFSPQALVSLLARAGLEVSEWIEGTGSFIACLARPAPSQHFQCFAEAHAALIAGRPAQALSAYAAVREDAPPALRAEALLARAEVLASAGDFPAACQAVLDAAALSPDDARSLAGLSELSFATGDPKRSLELAIGAVERDPCEPNAVQSLARAAESLQRDEAFATWRIANGLAPADIAVASEASRLASERGEHMYAIWVLERLREFRGELGVDFHTTLAWLYVNAERVGEARLEAELARAKDPDAPGVKELWAHLGS